MATINAAAQAQVHDRDREAARNPEPPDLDRADRLDERIEQQRDAASRPGRGRRRERRVPRPPTPGSAGAEVRPAASSAGSGSSAPRRGSSRRSYSAGRTASSGRGHATARWPVDPDDWWVAATESLAPVERRRRAWLRCPGCNPRPPTGGHSGGRPRCRRRARHRAILLLVGLGVLVVLAVAAFRPDGRPAVGASAARQRRPAARRRPADAGA